MVLVAAALLASGCGTQANSVPSSSPYYKGAQLFSANCSGCHTLSAVGANGSATNVKDKERTDGPNFNVRKETVANVLYAIHNGGFSGAIMPENIVTGPDADAIALFLAKYSGADAPAPLGITTATGGASR